MLYKIFSDMTECSEQEVARLLPLVSEQRREQALRYTHTFGQYCCLKSYEMLTALLASTPYTLHSTLYTSSFAALQVFPRSRPWIVGDARHMGHLLVRYLAQALHLRLARLRGLWENRLAYRHSQQWQLLGAKQTEDTFAFAESDHAWQ